MQPLSIAIIGTTERTTQCAQALQDSDAFSIAWILTPEPKPIGRKKVLTKNPLHVFGETHDIPTVTFSKKVREVQEKLHTLPAVDFILVVDFGYIVPAWLLQLPTIAPLNIHPSDLPKWRGSSPGQFCLLHGEKKSAVVLMKMNEKLDQGPIISSVSFTIEPNWDASDYYSHSFALISEQLPDLIQEYAENRQESAQPDTSPTPIAERIHKDYAFIPWELLRKAQTNAGYQLTQQEKNSLSRIVADALPTHPTFSHLVVAATKAFSPWPKLWTLVPTSKGEKRMQLHSTSVLDGTLQLETVQIEGQSPALFNQVSNSIVEK